LKPLRFGIVGCGIISGTHGNVLKKLHEEGLATLVAAADIDRGKAESFTEKFGGTPVGSLEELLSNPEVDAVTLCTPSGLHGRMAVQAAKAGKHVLSEKPLDVWIDQVDEAIEATRAAGVVYGGIFQERFTKDAQKLKRAVSSGAFGDIVLACAETKWYRSPEYYAQSSWRGSWELDAGVFSNQGIHSLDKVQWLAGEVVEVLSASGALGTITMTTLAYDGFPERVDVSGTRGSAMLVGDHLAHFTTQDPFEEHGAALGVATAEYPDKSKDPAALGVEGHEANVRDYVLAVQQGNDPMVSAVEARRAVNLLNMIYKKAKVGPYA